MTWVSADDLESWQEAVNRGEELGLDECRHLLAEVRRLKRLTSDPAPYCADCGFNHWGLTCAEKARAR